jgi:hypothetical protein
MHFGISSSTAVMLVIVLEKCNFVVVDAVVMWVQRTGMQWKD